jgi:hypothetical protein
VCVCVWGGGSGGGGGGVLLLRLSVVLNARAAWRHSSEFASTTVGKGSRHRMQAGCRDRQDQRTQLDTISMGRGCRLVCLLIPAGH